VPRQFCVTGPYAAVPSESGFSFLGFAFVNLCDFSPFSSDFVDLRGFIHAACALRSTKGFHRLKPVPPCRGSL
jgi:hypothetical protein